MSIDMPAVFLFAKDLMDTLHSFEPAQIAINLLAILVSGGVMFGYFMIISARD
jgi:hypothetical protein